MGASDGVGEGSMRGSAASTRAKTGADTGEAATRVVKTVQADPVDDACACGSAPSKPRQSGARTRVQTWGCGVEWYQNIACGLVPVE